MSYGAGVLKKEGSKQVQAQLVQSEEATRYWSEFRSGMKVFFLLEVEPEVTRGREGKQRQ